MPPDSSSTDRLYYRDSQLLEFTAQVIAITEVGTRSALILDRTAFYPTSGGQPHDTGKIGTSSVVDVIDTSEAILHVVDGPTPPVSSNIVGSIDQERRRDHTQQHSGQHVLSQAFLQAGNHQTVSFHLGSDTCTIDLNTTSLSSSIVRDAENLANQIVLDNRPVVIHFSSPEDLERFGLRKLPERTGIIRVVEITDFDRSACGGTHVRQTGEIGPIKVRRWERRGTTTRVEFSCGERALRDYQARLDATRALAERLSVSDSDLVPTVSRALENLAQLRDEVMRLRNKLLDYEAGDLLAAGVSGESPLPATIVSRAFPDRPVDELKHLALAIVKCRPAIAMLASCGERSQFVFAQSPGLPYDLSTVLRQVLATHGGRGGGTRDLAQGGCPDGNVASDILEEAQRILLGG